MASLLNLFLALLLCTSSGGKFSATVYCHTQEWSATNSSQSYCFSCRSRRAMQFIWHRRASDEDRRHGGREAGVRGVGDQHLRVLAVAGAPAVLRPQQRRAGQPPRHQAGGRGAVHRRRWPTDNEGRSDPVQVRLDDSPGLSCHQHSDPLPVKLKGSLQTSYTWCPPPPPLGWSFVLLFSASGKFSYRMLSLVLALSSLSMNRLCCERPSKSIRMPSLGMILQILTSYFGFRNS